MKLNTLQGWLLAALVGLLAFWGPLIWLVAR